MSGNKDIQGDERSKKVRMRPRSLNTWVLDVLSKTGPTTFKQLTKIANADGINVTTRGMYQILFWLTKRNELEMKIYDKEKYFSRYPIHIHKLPYSGEINHPTPALKCAELKDQLNTSINTTIKISLEKMRLREENERLTKAVRWVLDEKDLPQTWSEFKEMLETKAFG